jgi:8-oxo-dGTP pyrophosphatase MutT (NUDIX family)
MRAYGYPIITNCITVPTRALQPLIYGEMMIRDIRYQAAIIHNRQILLIQHREHASGRSYWLLPGGGREADETPEQ